MENEVIYTFSYEEGNAYYEEDIVATRVELATNFVIFYDNQGAKRIINNNNIISIKKK